LPGLVSNISGSCVIGVYVFLKVNFCFVKILIKQEKISMKTRMKKLISISTIAVLALALLVVLGTVLADDAEKPAPSLRCTTEYFFVAGLGITDAEGRVLCWEGPISGDIEGVIQWWMFLEGPNAPSTGQVGHHAGGRFVIWDIDPVLYPDDAVLLLAGDDEESTTVRHGKNSLWRGHGIVTDGELADWIGRSMHEGGHFTWAEPGLPDHGTGTFRIN